MEETKHTRDARESALEVNAQAVRAVVAAVEGTIGPKGLDTMLIDKEGNVIITNDGATILEQMEIHHPIARLLIHTARTQKDAVGDGTTTATVLAGAMVEEGIRQIAKGVPVTKITEGIAQAASYVTDALDAMAHQEVSDEELYRLAQTAGRQNAQVADAAMCAVDVIGRDCIAADDIRLADWVTSKVGAETEVTAGVTLCTGYMNHVQPTEAKSVRIAVFDDALEPIRMERDALRTEVGAQRYLLLQEEFCKGVARLVEAGVGLVIADRGIDPMADAILSEAGILTVARVDEREWKRILLHTKARPLKRTMLTRPTEVWQDALGTAEHLSRDEDEKIVRVAGGIGQPMTTIVVGAPTADLAEEKKRITQDAVSAVQSALCGGWVSGGGATEIALARALEQKRATVCDMTGYGMDCVKRALLEPVYQMIRNAGYHPLEKAEAVSSCQQEYKTDQYGFDCDNGNPADMTKLGVLDSALVKRQAIKAASEVASAILKVNAIVRMRPQTIEDRYE